MPRFLNCHLAETLGIDAVPPDLGQHFTDVAEYVRGSRSDLGKRPIISTTPPSPHSKLIRPIPTDPLLERFGVHQNGVTFLRVGKFSEKDVGANCYHTKLSTLCVLLNHLADSPNEYVVVDATAGVDTVATPLSVAYDLMVFVVEPTAKSTQVVLDYLATDRSCSERLVVVANKVSDQSDVTFIGNRVGAQRVIGTIHQNRSLKLFEQGDPECFEAFVTANDSIWASVDHRLCAIERSWEGMHEALVTVHRKNCEWWYNSFYGESLDTGLDGAFPLI